MADTSVLITLTQGSAVGTCAAGTDLTNVATPAVLYLTGIDQTLAAAKTGLPIQSFSKAGNAWTINLAANFANPTLALVAATVRTGFTALGFNQWDTSDTATKPMLNADNVLSEQLYASLETAQTRLGIYTGLLPAANNNASLGPAKLASTGTVAVFHLDEGGGTTAQDAAGRLTATLSGATGWSTLDGGNVGSSVPRQVFPTGSALILDGTSGCATVPNLFGAAPVSGAIGGWFCPGRNYPSGTNAFLLSIGQQLQVYIDGTTGGLTAVAGGVAVTAYGAPWEPGHWHHVVLSWGTRFLGLYVDGVLNGVSVSFPGISGAVAGQPLVLGASAGGPSQFFNGQMDEIFVLDHRPLPEEIHAAYWRTPYFPGMEESGKWGARQDVLLPTGQAGDFRKDLLIELCPVWNGSKFLATYTGYNIGEGINRLGWAESADGLNWTDHGQFLGQGIGGEASTVGTSSLYYEGGTYYIYYAQHTTGSHVLVTTTNPNFGAAGALSAPVVMLDINAAPGWVGDSYYNSSMAKDAGTYYKIIEAGQPGIGHYVTGVATASSPAGPWTPSPNPLTTLQIGTGAYSPGSLTTRQADGYFHLWYHTSDVEPSPPAVSSITRARSTDCQTWEIVTGSAAIELQGEQFSGGPADQIADARVVVASSQVFLFYDLDRNSGVAGQQGRAGVMRFAGALTDLLASGPTAVLASSVPRSPIKSAPTAAQTFFGARYAAGTSAPGVALGFYTTPRILLSTGNPAERWEFDNYQGLMRFFQDNNVVMTLDETGQLNIRSMTLADIGPLPASGSGAEIVFSQGHYYGWNGQWYQLDIFGPDGQLKAKGIVLSDIGPLPASGSGAEIVFSQGHYYGWNGQWKQLDN